MHIQKDVHATRRMAQVKIAELLNSTGNLLKLSSIQNSPMSANVAENNEGAKPALKNRVVNSIS